MGLLYGKCGLPSEGKGEVQRLDGNGWAWRRTAEPVRTDTGNGPPVKIVNSFSRVDVNMKYETYCNAISDGGEEEWDFAWKRWEGQGFCRWRVWLTRYTESTVASEKSTLLSSLGCTKEVWLLNRYFLFLKFYYHYCATFEGVWNVLNTVWSRPKLWNFWKSFL